MSGTDLGGSGYGTFSGAKETGSINALHSHGSIHGAHSLHHGSRSNSFLAAANRHRRSIRRGSKTSELWEPVLAHGWVAYLKKSLSALFFEDPLNLLLLAVPIAIISKQIGCSDSLVFIFSLIALCPLAERLGFLTEEMAKYTNDTVGGLLNASMGNATEMIVSLFAIKEGKLKIVQLSLIGSVLGNLLLVLGCSFFIGGLKFNIQKYSTTAANVNSGLLLLATMGLMFPSILAATNQESHGEASGLLLSRLTSMFLLIAYFLLLLYQLRTHSSVFEGQEEDDDEEDDAPILGFWGAIFWCAFVTIVIAVLSDYIVVAIEGAAYDLGVPVVFISAILLPIVGNAAEHAAAVIFAWRNKMDISLGIAVGSATQISLFVIPFSVVVAWIVGQPLSLNFQLFETSVFFITILIVCMVLQSGQSDWLRGMLLIFAYFTIAVSFWVHVTPPELLHSTNPLGPVEATLPGS